MTQAGDHAPEVIEDLERLRGDEQRVLEIGMQLLGSSGAPLFPLDLLAYGALKRNLSTSSAIILLVENFNLVSARALLRVHIDTALRFSAAWFVDRPHDFASAVHGGARIDKLKDREGVRLTDSRLVELLAPDYPWLPTVYERLSGYVHFSGSHISASITSFDEETHKASLQIGKADKHFPPFSWLEILRCAHEATGILTRYLGGYIKTKAMSAEELAAAKNGV